MDLREGLLGFLQVRCFPTRLVGGFCSSSCRFLQPFAARHSSRIPATELGSGGCFPMHMIAGGWPRIIQHTTPLYLGITYIGVVRKQPACNSLSGLAKDKGQRKKVPDSKLPGLLHQPFPVPDRVICGVSDSSLCCSTRGSNSHHIQYTNALLRWGGGGPPARNSG